MRFAESQKIEERLFVALDYDTIYDPTAEAVVAAAAEFGIGVKIGTQLAGGDGWEEPTSLVHNQNVSAFIDTKLDDIPTTVSKTVTPIFKLKPAMVNMHANAGYKSMEAFLGARSAVDALSSLAIAVTVLTPKDDTPMPRKYTYASEGIGEVELETGRTAKNQVIYLATLAARIGFDGIVCSASDIEYINQHCELQGLYKVTPGIRPVWAPKNDQARIETPFSAIRAGATHLVVGRPITEPPAYIGTYSNAIESILEEMSIADWGDND